VRRREQEVLIATRTVAGLFAGSAARARAARLAGLPALAAFAVLAGFVDAARAAPRPGQAPLQSPVQSPAETGAARLDALAEEYWQHELARSPALRVKEGLPVEELPALTYQEAEADAAWARGMLDRLAAIDADAFNKTGAAEDHERWLTDKILEWQLRQAVAAPSVFWYRFQVTPYAWSFTGAGQTLAQVPVASAADRDRYLHLLDQVPGIAETLRANLETQRQKGILVPRPEIDLVVATLSPLTAPSAQHPYRVAAARLDGVDAAAAAAFQKEVAGRIDTKIAPAFGHLVALFDDAYREEAPAAVGLGQYPGGAEAYRTLVRYHTTLDLTPEEIHRRGVEEVARIEGEMAKVRTVLGSDASTSDFNAMLRTDPRFLACDPDGVAERLTRPLRKIEPLIDRWFLHTPEAPYGVARLDPALEPGMTYGYYQWPTPGHDRGLYLFNGSQLDQRSLVQAAALIYHELVPGHHFQIALQNENETLPAFRRNAFPTAFVEGWAEYASGLAGEMGLYAEPYDRYGRLAMDMFLSCRLVVDTGMNALGWSRQRALDFMGQRVIESGTQLATETLRYSTDIPAQALAYKIGAATIWRLRHRAEEDLGDGFDVRRFHDAVLGHGAMPLTVLEAHVDWWIAQQRKAQEGADAAAMGR